MNNDFKKYLTADKKGKQLEDGIICRGWVLLTNIEQEYQEISNKYIKKYLTSDKTGRWNNMYVEAKAFLRNIEQKYQEILNKNIKKYLTNILRNI